MRNMDPLRIIPLLLTTVLSLHGSSQPGTLDPTFGTGGQVLTDIGNGNDYFRAIVVQPDGRIVSAGGTEYLASMWGCFALMRHNTDGTLDDDFGGDGIVSTNINAGDAAWSTYVGNNSAVTDLALLPDGRLLAVGRSFTVISGSGWNRLAMARYMADGSPDPSLNTNGWMVELGLGCVDAFVAVMDDGRYVVAAAHGFGDFNVLRYNPDGTRDTSFGGDGHITHQVGTGGNQVRGVGVMADGRIIVGGSYFNSVDNDEYLVRFDPDGSVDSTYNGTGVVTSAPGIYNDDLNDMIVHDDGSVVIAGTTMPPGGVTQWLLQRFLPDGSPDPTFAGTGTLIHPVAPDGGDLRSIAERSDGEFLVTGSRYIAGSSEALSAAFTTQGALITAYGVAGYCAFPVTPHVLYPNSIALGANDQAAVVGRISIDGGNVVFDAGVVSITPTGTLETLFNGTGTVMQDLGIGGDIGMATAMQPDGKLVTASRTQWGGMLSMAVSRYGTDGTPDATFGNGGSSIVSMDSPLCIAVQPDGKILVGVDYAFALYRLNTDGSLDLTFNGIGWAAIYDFLGSSDQGAVRRIIVQPDGKILAAGFAGVFPQINKAFALARFNPDGSLDTGFGGDGKVVTDLAFSNWEEIDDMALMPDGRIVVTGYAITAEGFVAARYEPDGDPDPTFGGGDGVINHLIGPGYWGRSKRLALRTDGRILLAGYSQLDADPLDFDIVLMQLLTNGTLDAGFGTGGKVIMDIGASMQEITGLALQSDGKALAAGYANFGSTDDFLLLRYDITGQLDASFGTAGMVTTDFGPFADHGHGLLIQPDGKAVVTGFAVTSSDIDVALARYELGTINGIPEPGTVEMNVHVWPSPLTPSSVASFTLAEPATVSARLFDAQGRLALVLMTDRTLAAGAHRIALDGAQRLSHGIYTLILRSTIGFAEVNVVR